MRLTVRIVLSIALLTASVGCNGCTGDDKDGKDKKTTGTTATRTTNPRLHVPLLPRTGPATQPDNIVIAIIAEHFGVEQPLVTRKSALADLGGDDLDRVEIAMEIEERFRLEIPDADVDKLQTVGQIVDYVNARLAQK